MAKNGRRSKRKASAVPAKVAAKMRKCTEKAFRKVLTQRRLLALIVKCLRPRKRKSK